MPPMPCAPRAGFGGANSASARSRAAWLTNSVEQLLGPLEVRLGVFMGRLRLSQHRLALIQRLVCRGVIDAHQHLALLDNIADIEIDP